MCKLLALLDERAGIPQESPQAGRDDAPAPRAAAAGAGRRLEARRALLRLDRPGLNDTGILSDRIIRIFEHSKPVKIPSDFSKNCQNLCVTLNFMEFEIFSRPRGLKLDNLAKSRENVTVTRICGKLN